MFEIIEMNWTGLARSLQPEIIGSTSGLLVILIAWLAMRWGARRAGAGVAPSQLYKWTNRGASLLAIVIVGGLLWHALLVVSINRLPRQDVDRSVVYERMDGIIKK